MNNKKKQLEINSALATSDVYPYHARIMPEAIGTVSDDTSWTAHVTEYLTKTSVHAGEVIHPGKIEIGKPVSSEAMPSYCHSTYTLNGEHLPPLDFAQSVPIIYKTFKQCIKESPNPIAQPVQFKPLTMAGQINPYALKLYTTSTSEISGGDRRSIDRRKSRQPFPDFINAAQDSGNVAPGTLESLLFQGYGAKISLKSGAATPVLDNIPLVASDCDPINVCILSDRESLLATQSQELAREPDIKVNNHSIGNPARLLARLKQWPPKLLLLDMASLDQLGAEWLRMIRTKVPSIRILLIWDEADPGVMDVIMRHRIHGCLPTSCLHEVYVKAIRAVAGGDLWLPRSLLAKAYSDLSEPGGHCHEEVKNDQCSPNAMDALTKREQEIVGFLSQGLSNKQIARQLGIMEDTVKKHLQNIFRKFGVRRRTLVMLRQVTGQ